MRTIIRPSILIAILATASHAQEPASRPAEVYTSVLLTEVELIDGKWPDERSGQFPGWFGVSRGPWSEVTLDAPAEGFLGRSWDKDVDAAPGPRRIVARSAPGADLRATLTLLGTTAAARCVSRSGSRRSAWATRRARTS